MSAGSCPKCGAALAGMSGRTCPDCPEAQVRRVCSGAALSFLAAGVVFPDSEASLALGLLAAALLWPLISRSLWRRLTADAEGGGEKAFFGLMAVALAGLASALLVSAVLALSAARR